MYRQTARDAAARTKSGVRTLVIRGDLYSDTGYARATRALAGVLSSHASRMFGVSLHAHARRRRTAIDIPVVDDAALHESPFFDGALVLNVCLPDEFVRVARADNVGYFFWETEAMPRARFWTAQMSLMDRIWAPSRWQSDYLRRATGRAEIPVVPWPLEAASRPADEDDAALSAAMVHPPMNAAELDNHLVRHEERRASERPIEAARHAAGRSARFDPARSPRLGALIESAGDLFVAVQSDAARKGLPLLLASWLRFKASEAGRQAKLVIKMSPLDVGADLEHVHVRASLAVRQASRRCGVADPAVWFVHDPLSEAQMRALLRAADAVVTATMGEGFGGPIAEALIEGTPVIAPRHTAICDLLDANYPLIVASEPHVLDLWGNLDVYPPASPWHLVDDVAFARQLAQFVRMPAEIRRDIAKRARDRLLAHAGQAAVARTLSAELDRCDTALDASPPAVIKVS